MDNLQTWHNGAIFGGVILLLCAVLYFLPVRKLKVPGGVGAGFGGLAAGLAAGIIWLAGFGVKPPVDEGDGAAKEGVPKGGGAPKMGGPPKSGGPDGSAPPGPRVQLINLINALDKIVDRPPTVALTADERATIAEQLKGLDVATEIKDEDATAKVEAIQKVVDKDRRSLEAIGYRWQAPPAKTGYNTSPSLDMLLASPNPFHHPETSQKIKSLQERLGKK